MHGLYDAIYQRQRICQEVTLRNKENLHKMFPAPLMYPTHWRKGKHQPLEGTILVDQTQKGNNSYAAKMLWKKYAEMFLIRLEYSV